MRQASGTPSLRALLAALIGLAPMPAQSPLSPASATAAGDRAFVVERTADALALVDLGRREVTGSVAVGSRPECAAIRPGSGEVFVACRFASRIDVVDPEDMRVVRSIPCGPEPVGLCFSRDGRTLAVALSQADRVAFLDADSGKPWKQTAVGRDPRGLALHADGERLLIGAGLGREIAILSMRTGDVLDRRSLDRGNLVRGVAFSPDGKYALAAHVISHDEVTPTQIERSWIHGNGVSVCDLRRPGHRVTVLLDRLFEGAANPWGLAFSADGERLLVALAGVHEIAILDWRKLAALVDATPLDRVKALERDTEALTKAGILTRAPCGGLGPRDLAALPDGRALVPCYFSDRLMVLDDRTGARRAAIALGPEIEPGPRRRGEQLFQDGRLSFQGWFSCMSCHQEDATMDGLNWDLTNDGVGNPKNAKSLHDAFDTPPAMWTGVRADLEAATAAGQRFLGFLPDPRNQEALVAFLSAPERAPNPFRGRDPAAEARGLEVFEQARCGACHPPPAFTDLRRHDLGLCEPGDPSPRFDTPSLRECYRTAPYLHDGRAPTLRSIFTEHDPLGLHGRTKGLRPEQLDDLIHYLKTL
ncbi:MAG: YncE family protein [Planctomycetota bacterium]